MAVRSADDLRNSAPRDGDDRRHVDKDRHRSKDNNREHGDRHSSASKNGHREQTSKDSHKGEKREKTREKSRTISPEKGAVHASDDKPDNSAPHELGNEHDKHVEDNSPSRETGRDDV